MHHAHFFTGRGIEQERLLCSFAEGGREAAQTLRVERAIRENQAIADMRRLYKEADVQKDYPEISGERNVNQAFVEPLLLEGMLPKNVDIQDVGHKDLRPFDPLRLVQRFADDAALGEWLMDHFDGSILRQLQDKTDAAILGAAYRDAVDHADRTWNDKQHNDKKELTDTDKLLLRMPLEYYRGVREGFKGEKGLDDVLRNYGIRVPDKENVGLRDLGNGNLNRTEYFSLLVLCAKEYVDLQKVAPILQSEKTEGVRRIIREAESIDRLVGSLEPIARDKAVDRIGDQLQQLAPQENLLEPDYSRDALDPINALIQNTGLIIVLEKGRFIVRSRLQTDDPAGGRSGASLTRMRNLFIPLSIDTLGVDESLVNFGVSISPNVIQNYIRLLGRKAPDLGKRADIPGQEVLLPEEEVSGEQLPVESAATWEAHPERAYSALLACGMTPDGIDSNALFLRSLEYHFVMSPEQRKAFDDRLKQKPPGLRPYSEENTRAILNSVIQTLMEKENIMRATHTRQEELRSSLNFGEKVEKGARNVWEYMNDISSHPLGSALAWIVAIVAVRKGWDILFNKDSNRFMKGIFWGSLAGIAVGLYQQNKQGKAWWESITPKIDELLRREKSLPPEKQTLPDYWHKELGMTEHREIICLSVLGSQPTKAILDWYDECERLGVPIGGPNGNAGKPIRLPALPFTMDAKMRSRLGEMPTQERSKLFHATLKKFLANRGAAVRRELPEYKPASALQNDAALGADYIRERYIEQRLFQSIFKGVVAIGNVSVDADTLTQWMQNPNNQEWEKNMAVVQQQQPALYGRLLVIRDEYLQELRERDTAQWDMNMVFLLEADPAILRRQGKSQAAGYLDFINSGVAKTADALNPMLEPQKDLAKRMQLLDSAPAESALINSLTGGKLSNPENIVTKEKLQKEWDEFVDRLPADKSAQAALKGKMKEYLNGRVLNLKTMNEIERRKYQMLIAAVGSKTRLSVETISRLDDPKNDQSWNSWIDFLLDYVQFDEDHFPGVSCFADLHGLLGSEVHEKDSAETYEVWKRMFPRWQENSFSKTLRPRIDEYTKAFKRLRYLPVLSDAAGKNFTPLTQEQIDAMEQQISQRMANRFVEAVLKRHGSDVRDDESERTVSPTEQRNLAEYCDAVFSGLLGVPAEQLNANVKLPGLMENANDWIWNTMPGKVRAISRETGAVLKEYMWDPVQKYWVETAGPWIQEYIDKGVITLGQGVNYADAKLQECLAVVGPMLQRLPGDTIRITGNAGKYVIEWFDKARNVVGPFAYESYKDAEKAIYALHGIPEQDYEQFKENMIFIENHAYNGKNAGVRISVLGTKEVVIGLFDSLPFTNDGHSISIPANTFAKADIAQLKKWMEEWREQGFNKQQKDVAAILARGDLQWRDIQKLTIKRIGDEGIEIGIPGDQSMSSIYSLLSTDAEGILGKYKKWLDQGVRGTDALL